MITVSNVPHIHIYRSDTKKYSIYITPDMTNVHVKLYCCVVSWYGPLIPHNSAI